jgi:hypothetical protein
MIPNQKPGPVPTMVIYRAKAGQDAALSQLVKQHYPTISKLGLATAKPAQVWKSTDREGKVAFVEMFEWKDASSSQVAHHTPEVRAVWEPMTNVLESIEISHVEPVE